MAGRERGKRVGSEHPSTVRELLFFFAEGLVLPVLVAIALAVFALAAWLAQNTVVLLLVTAVAVGFVIVFAKDGVLDRRRRSRSIDDSSV